MNTELETLTVKEVAAWLRVDPQQVYRMAQKGEVPAFKVRGAWRFSRRLLEEWIEAGGTLSKAGKP